MAVLDAEGGRPFVHGVKVYRGIGRNQDSRKPAWQQRVPMLILPPGGWGERGQAVKSVLQSFMVHGSTSQQGLWFPFFSSTALHLQSALFGV